jgi:MFS family permease
VCLTAGLFFFYEFFQLNVFDVINPILRLDFRIHASELSWMSSSFVWTNVLFLLPAGFILDRYPLRNVILSAMLSCVLGTLGFALTHSFIWAAGFHAMTGIGNAFCFLACVVLVSRWFEPRHQALVIGCIVTMAFLGGMMAHTPFAYLTHHLGWRYAMLIDAGIGILMWVTIAAMVRNPPQYKNTALRHNSWLADLTRAAANPQNWLAGLYTACLNLPIMVLCALWGGSYLTTVHHLQPLMAANVVSLIFFGSIVGCPLMGWLSDKHGQRKPIMISGAVFTGIALIPLCLQLRLSLFELSMIFFGLGFFTSAQVISYPLIAESNPHAITGSATGLASVIIMGSAGVAQVLFGWLMMLHSSPSHVVTRAEDLQFAFWIFPIATLVGLIACILLRETHCQANQNKQEEPWK